MYYVMLLIVTYLIRKKILSIFLHLLEHYQNDGAITTARHPSIFAR